MPFDPGWVLGWGRQRAVEYLERQIAETLEQSDGDGTIRRFLAKDGVYPERLADLTITLPLHAASEVLDCARKGLRKGGGRGNIPLSTIERNKRKDLIVWAKQRKAELIATRHDSVLVGPHNHRRPSAAKAEAKAAEEASARSSYHFAKNTIIRAMRSRL